MDTLDQILKKALLAAIKLRNLVHFLLVVARGLGVSTLARISRARSFAACKVHWTLHLSGSANRGDFSRIMQLEVVDSRDNVALKRLRRNIFVSMYISELRSVTYV